MTKLNQYLEKTSKKILDEIKDVVSTITNPEKAISKIAKLIDPKLTAKVEPRIMSILTGKKEKTEKKDDENS